MPGKTFIALILLGVGFFSTISLYAEEVFVKDSLRVGVRVEPGNAIAPVYVVTTGMKLTVLETSGNYVKIKSESGVTGWVKKSYVSPEPPARVFLQQLQEEYKQQNSKLVEQIKVARVAELNAQTLNEEIAILKKNTAELQIQLDDARSENLASSYSYLWKLGLLTLIGVIGFVVGVFWHRSYAMKRLGGLNI
ncbi:hypothetical protein MNBD_GAMMA21-994 [hydrothermal vent metagenome]|uniref:SH3b domain-containing protein n=1 Tax=hydrothermal vent metagenome TaxID=652676 RepID=A0A3B1A9P8_9ZZZZ